VDGAYQRHQAADFAALRTHELSSLLRPFLILLRIVHHIHRMPRTENVSFSFSKSSNVTRVGSLCQTGAGLRIRHIIAIRLTQRLLQNRLAPS